ncbi:MULTISPECIES: hypothetical protein [Achromobacter]|uniref:Uncharacterized protein n=1 Tax=Achromobacter spanius TaxID=217203 RepID=A0ABY8GYF9_9BURK|nr:MULTISPECIES: hypothetical protein [Achromobacter]WAI81239.1 hypothetical protein N8Z00_16985 [Achromobacter spanius]WEX96757.1 hypothetical protein N3Z32_11590 [Achromobacter sp. SS2-2022]WFP09528.1 hypothetical protein P8T11_06520 [Achromobacter spanius]
MHIALRMPMRMPMHIALRMPMRMPMHIALRMSMRMVMRVPRRIAMRMAIAMGMQSHGRTERGEKPGTDNTGIRTGLVAEAAR